MDIGDVVLGFARRAGLGDGLAFAHVVAATHEQRPEMRERGLVASRGDDRDRRPVRRHLTRERDLAGRRRAHHLGAVERDVDAAMLSACIRVVADREATEDRAVGRPVPGERVRGRQQQPGCRRGCDHGESRCPAR